MLIRPHSEDLSYAQVGRWNHGDFLDNYDEFEILDFYEHPLYYEYDLPYDFMLLKLSGQSTKQYVKLNDNPNLPTGDRTDEVTVMGFGYTRPSDGYSRPDILKHVDLTYVPNDICEQAKDPIADDGYLGLITPDMLCANDNGQDSCQGDSGGPLIIEGGMIDYANDVLVGVVSWCV